MPPAFAERTSEHLYAIVHRWPGTCQPQEQLQPPEQSLARDEDAREVLALGYLADLRLRFVFTQPGNESMALARASDLARLDLTPHKALALATMHLRKAGATPTLQPQTNGTYRLQSPQPLLLESHLTDRNFWRGLLAVLRLSVYMLIGALLLQAVLSWVQPYGPLTRPLAQLTDPFLAPLRRLVPPISGFDLTPLIAVLLANIVLIFL